MSWLSKFFNPGEQERNELTDAYNQAYEADLDTSAMEDLESQLEQQGYKVQWTGSAFELVDD